jgi:predicted PurR-regulated permease PerM
VRLLVQSSGWVAIGQPEGQPNGTLLKGESPYRPHGVAATGTAPPPHASATDEGSNLPCLRFNRHCNPGEPEMLPMSDLPSPTRPILRPGTNPPALTHLLTLVSVVVVIAALYVGREVLVPITLAVLLSFVLAPLVALLRRAMLGRVPSVILAVVLALGIILAIGGVIGMQVAQLAESIPQYADTVRGKVDSVRSFTIGKLNAVVGDIGSEMRHTAPASEPPAPTASAGKPATTSSKPAAAPVASTTALGSMLASNGDAQKPIPVEVQQPGMTPLEIANRIISPVLSPLSTTGIVFIVAVFVLLQQEDLRDRMIRLFGSDDLHRTTQAMDEAGSRLSHYFIAQLSLNVAFGVVIAIGLAFIGVPNPVLWGILAALFRFVPYIGSLISGLLPLALAAAVDPGWSMMLWTAALFLIAEPIMGQLVEPLVYGHSTGLSPVAVIVAAIFWAWLWGPIGLILSMPLTLCLVVVGRNVKRLEFIDIMFGDRPALTPMQSFYQRVLAGKEDEVQDAAERLLKSHSLIAYYDHVALKGLELASADAARGVLSPEQLIEMRAAVVALVHELDEHDDADDAPVDRDKLESDEDPIPQGAPLPHVAQADLSAAWQGACPVLCIAGRGPLDDAVAVMLAQLLRKHGLGARTLPHDAVSRDSIGELDTDGVALVCISYLTISGSPTHLRYMIRRIRQRLPNATVIVGLWPTEESDMDRERLRTAVGADHYITTLHDAVATCLHRAQAGHVTAAAA